MTPDDIARLRDEHGPDLTGMKHTYAGPKEEMEFDFRVEMIALAVLAALALAWWVL